MNSNDSIVDKIEKEQLERFDVKRQKLRGLLGRDVYRQVDRLAIFMKEIFFKSDYPGCLNLHTKIVNVTLDGPITLPVLKDLLSKKAVSSRDKGLGVDAFLAVLVEASKEQHSKEHKKDGTMVEPLEDLLAHVE